MMETSDSEYFESADEDFQSDEEDMKTIKSVVNVEKKSDNKCINSTTTQLENLHIKETSVETNISGLDTNKNSKNPHSDNLEKDDESNANFCKISKKEGDNKGEVKKLKTKVDKKVDNTKTETTTHVSKQALKEKTKESTVDSKPENSQLKTEIKETPKIEEQPEENLWDDDEIDWGKEVEVETKWSKEKEIKTNLIKEKEEKNIFKQTKNESKTPKEVDEDNMWGSEDDWEPVETPKQTYKIETPQEPQTSWGSWGNWGGVSSLLSTASQSVSTITQGITTVLETGIGVPDPEELARINQAEKEKLKDLAPEIHDDKNTSFGLGNFVMGVSHLTKLVETTSTKVISGGLDTLETIGKKTMEVLQEGDPGLKKKRAFLKIDQDKPVLSQLLREAKEKAEEENKILEQKHFAKKAKNYETLFDDHQGLVHLEALEMLSKQCDIKLQTLLESYTDESLTELQETMDQVKELCELPDEDEDEQANWSEILEKLNSAVTDINVPISYKKLIDTWEETEIWINTLKLDICDEHELHQQAVETLAQLTAIAVEQFHKAGELLLIKEHRSTADEADSLVQLTTSLTTLIGIVAAKFSDKLNAKSANSNNKEAINGLITNVFFEAANSSSYIQDAFQLLVPVLQVGAV